MDDDEIYYGSEASWAYMGVSQYKDFMKCEAQALAKLKGEWDPISNPKALLVGNYVHSHFEGVETHDKFKQQNAKELFKAPTISRIKEALDSMGISYKGLTKKDELEDLFDSIESDNKPFISGGMYSEYLLADVMIKRIEEEQLFNFIWDGEKESVVTGELFGMDWKGKIDLLNVEKGYFVDLKTTAQLDKRFWSDKYMQYVSFIEEFGYALQIAVYERLLELKYGKPFTGYIYAVTKQATPDVAAIEIEDLKKGFELTELEATIDRVSRVKNGQEIPERCGHCDYCKQDKQLDGFIMSSDLLR